MFDSPWMKGKSLPNDQSGMQITLLATMHGAIIFLIA